MYKIKYKNKDFNFKDPYVSQNIRIEVDVVQKVARFYIGRDLYIIPIKTHNNKNFTLKGNFKPMLLSRSHAKEITLSAEKDEGIIYFDYNTLDK